MHIDFEKASDELRNKYLFKTEELFVSKKNEWFADFAEHFNSLCAEIVKLQSESLISALSYLEFTMVNANFIERRYISEVWVYGAEHYNDKNQRMVGEYDISLLFVYFDEMWNELLSVRKRYAGKVSAREVTEIMMKSAKDFYSYFSRIVQVPVIDCAEHQPFVDIAKNNMFKIYVGSYMGSVWVKFVENKEKSASDIKDFHEKNIGIIEQEHYKYCDFSRLDFSGRTIESTQFCGSQFRDSKFNNASLGCCDLAGTNFRRAQMENCILDFTTICGADFSYAVLKNANFTKTYGQAGLQNDINWFQAGILPLNFRYADLTNANFTEANLAGADFTGAILTGADFTDTILDEAVFDNCIGWKG